MELPTTPGFDYLIGKNWTVEEKVGTAFVAGNLDHEISSSVTLKGNVGMQFVQTDQSSQAFYKDNATNQVLPFDDGKKYNDVLPRSTSHSCCRQNRRCAWASRESWRAPAWTS